MCIATLLGGLAIVGGLYFIFKWYGSSDRHHGGNGDDDIDGYRNERVEYYVNDVAKGRLDHELMKRLKQKIIRYGNEAAVEYIGITSGTDPMKAMKSRVDTKKKQLGINEMRLLYQTSDRDDCTEVESELIKYSKTIHGHINENEKGGGGGRIPDTSQNYYVYAAYK